MKLTQQFANILFFTFLLGGCGTDGSNSSEAYEGFPAGVSKEMVCTHPIVADYEMHQQEISDSSPRLFIEPSTIASRQQRFSYDASANVILETDLIRYKNENIEEVEIHTEYNESNDITRKKTVYTNVDSGTQWLSLQEFDYDEQGNVIRSFVTDGQAYEKEETFIISYLKNKVEILQQVKGEEEPYKKNIQYFDDFARLINEESISIEDGVETLYRSQTNNYDARGNLAQSVTKYWTGSDQMTRSEIYDENGQVIKYLTRWNDLEADQLLFDMEHTEAIKYNTHGGVTHRAITATESITGTQDVLEWRYTYADGCMN